VNPVVVVIPVYRGLAETRACVESVLAAETRTPAEIVVVDDASPEPALREWVRALAASGQVRLVSHAENRGFVAAANAGMALARGRDVVLLNSDTEVASGWLDRLRAHATRDATIGTVTPFSTNATICSYPRTLADNPMPRGEDTASLDAAFAAANAGRCHEIPTGVGFCLLIAGRCLDAVGTFDAQRYGTGYGEEVDFCMRAARAGFRNVAAGDVFVRHVGEVSFGSTGTSRRAAAQETVDRLYPEFQQRLRAFLPADPLRALRRRADLHRLRRFPGQLRALPAGGRQLRLDWPRAGEEFALWLHPGRDRAAWGALRDFLDGRAATLPELDARWLAPAA